MPIKPEQDYVLLTISASSATLFVQDISQTRISLPFERSEFLHQRLKTAPENTGVEPQIVTLIFGVPGQILSSTIGTSARNLQPDDADINNIYQKMEIVRYTLRGDTSANSDTTRVYGWSVAHKILQERFEAHQKIAAGNISYQELVALQAETFSYLTSTGLTLTSHSFGTVNNLLIREFTVEADFYTPSSGLVLNKFSLTLDSITILPASSTS